MQLLALRQDGGAVGVFRVGTGERRGGDARVSPRRQARPRRRNPLLPGVRINHPLRPDPQRRREVREHPDGRQPAAGGRKRPRRS